MWSVATVDVLDGGRPLWGWCLYLLCLGDAPMALYSRTSIVGSYHLVGDWR